MAELTWTAAHPTTIRRSVASSKISTQDPGSHGRDNPSRTKVLVGISGCVR